MKKKNPSLVEINIEYLTMDFVYSSPFSAGTTDNSADM